MAVKVSLTISTLSLLLTLFSVQADISDNEFSDPDLMARVDANFQSIPVKYEENIGDVDVVISLGQQTYPALHKVVEKIAQEEGIKVAIQQGSCGTTAKRLLKKTADIGTYCCPPGKIDRLPGLEFHTVAITPIALTTNKVNRIDNVSTEDARKIFRGDYVTWSEVPGFEESTHPLTGKKIQPVVRLHCKKRPGHWRALLDNKDEFSPRAKPVATIQDMIKQIADNKTAIGYETPFMIKEHKDKGDVKILSIDGIHPNDLEKLRKAKYPLYRTYSMTTWTGEQNKNEKAEQLLRAIEKHIEENSEIYGFVPASQLRLAGWKFKGDELVGEPDGAPVIGQRN